MHESLGRPRSARTLRDKSALRLVCKAVREELSPRWIVLENVNGMRLWDGFSGLIAELKRQGYNLRIQSLDAASFGVPRTEGDYSSWAIE